MRKPLTPPRTFTVADAHALADGSGENAALGHVFDFRSERCGGVGHSSCGFW
jgi:hypothetical protein